MLGYELPLPVVTLGAITGMTYGLLAVGLIIVYRSSKVINFAHGEIGALGAAFLGVAVAEWQIPYWAAFPFAVALAAAVGAGTEAVVIRRLRRAPRVMSIVATLGLAQFLLLISLAIGTQIRNASLFPQPPGLPSFDLGALRVTPAYSGMLLLSPVLVVMLAVFLRRSRYGMAMRAAAANESAARLAGVFAARTSAMAWALAGAVAAATAILVFPTRGLIPASSLGPGLLLRALVAAVIARMERLPLALGCGVAVGVVEAVLLWNRPQAGFVDVVLLATVLVALLAIRRREGRDEERGSWLSVQPWPSLPEHLASAPAVRRAATAGLVALGLAGVTFGVVATNNAAVTMVFIIGTAIVGLSVGILTGLAGQASFGQFAVAGVTAVAAYAVTQQWMILPLAFAAAAVVGAAVAVLLGIPALRIRGLMLAVTTLAFALAAEGWLLRQPWALGSGRLVASPSLFGIDLTSSKRYYFFALGVLCLAIWLARNVWRGGIGRQLRAVRDNEDAARAFGVSAAATKMTGFAISGMLAGIGGATLAFASPVLRAEVFPISASVDVVAMTALGGIGLMAGPLLGAAYILGVPRFLPLDSAGLAATSFGWLLLILYAPGGIAQILRPLRDRVVSFLAGRAGIREDPASPAVSRVGVTPSHPAASPERRPAAAQRRGHILEVTRVSKAFGGLKAVQGVSLSIRRGQTVGLIGPNGAGKTTLFDLVSGFATPDYGRVVLEGEDITEVPPERRARLGMVRSFQDAGLFSTLPVLDCIALALERSSPTPLGRSMIGLDPTYRTKLARAKEIAGAMGLEPFARKTINELSTGTRRIVELSCAVALEPNLLLLDEPSSGVAQREVDALRNLLETLRSQLGMTLLVIEHHMPLVMNLSDRVIAMESGHIIADGTPREIQRDEQVLSSYLGGRPAKPKSKGARSRPEVSVT